MKRLFPLFLAFSLFGCIDYESPCSEEDNYSYLESLNGEWSCDLKKVYVCIDCLQENGIIGDIIRVDSFSNVSARIERYENEMYLCNTPGPSISVYIDGQVSFATPMITLDSAGYTFTSSLEFGPGQDGMEYSHFTNDSIALKYKDCYSSECSNYSFWNIYMHR
jgi:hypothetical protein